MADATALRRLEQSGTQAAETQEAALKAALRSVVQSGPALLLAASDLLTCMEWRAEGDGKTAWPEPDAAKQVDRLQKIGLAVVVGSVLPRFAGPVGALFAGEPDAKNLQTTMAGLEAASNGIAVRLAQLGETLPDRTQEIIAALAA